VIEDIPQFLPGGPPLAALFQRMKPVAGDLSPEALQHAQIPWDCMVLVVAVQHALQPFSNRLHTVVHPPP